MSESNLLASANTTYYSPRPDSDLSQTLAGLEVETALSALTERNRRIIEQKYGLVDGVPKSRQEIARQEDISPGRVGIIVRKSLGKISMLKIEQPGYSNQSSVDAGPLE